MRVWWMDTKSVVQMFWLLLALKLVSECDAANFVNYNCSGNNYTYISGSGFEANLNNTLFTVLPANASLSHFSNFSSGIDINTVYALYLCRGDIDAPSCHGCVETAAKKVVQQCPFNKEGIVWYQECMLRYANRSIFSLNEESPSYQYANGSSIVSAYNLDHYQDKFDTTMKSLINRTAYSYNVSQRGFGTQEFPLWSSARLRGLVQCTPDILGEKCQSCLTFANRQRNTWDDTMIFLPSCFVRFDVYGSLPPPPPIPQGNRKRKVILIAAVLLSAFGFFLFLGGFWFCKIRRHAPTCESRSTEETEIQSNIPEPSNTGRPPAVGFARFSYSEVEKMTKGFQRSLGKGGFGFVYYGRLIDDRKEVAVKVLSNDAPRQFSTEIEVFGLISHKNLVSLIGYCEDGTNLALIYEYMAGGDLRAVLSGPNYLNWRKRLEIAIDSAQGLDYLHNGCTPPIVHRDVKSPNILLNQQLRAKIADFGFSKIFPDEYVSNLSTRVIGSPGYVDPRYHSTAQLNEKSDVYSFGVVLLELITGKAAIVSEGTNLVQWVRPMLESGDMDNIVDPRLQRVQTRASVWRATDLAMECVKLDSSERPTMSLIVAGLKECLAMEIDPKSSMEMMSSLASVSTMAPSAR